MNAAGVREEKMPSLEREFADTTTLHGIVRIADKSKFTVLRIAWILAFLVCMGACIFNVYMRIHAFIQFEVNTKLSRVYSRPLEFPAVTICNFNRYRLSQITAQDQPYVDFALYADTYDYDSYNGANNKFTQDDFNYDTYFGNNNYSFDYEEFTRRAGFVLDDETLLDCRWRGRKCYAENFTHVFTSYGNCYSFNSGRDDDDKTVPILTEDQPGSENGLKVIINIQQEEYSETLDGNIQAGVKVLVHDQAEPPLMDALGSGIPPGRYAFMAIRREEYSNLGPPWGSCDKDKTLEHYDEYTLSGCFIECRLEHINRTCMCRPVSYPGNATVCSPQVTSSCVKNVLQKLKKGTLESCTCPIPCKYTKYSSLLSYGTLPNDRVSDQLVNEYNDTVEYLRNNLLVIDTFYDELNFESLTQNQALTFSGLISDIGGNLGLFLGGSLLTFAEIIEYIILKCMSPCRLRSRRETRPTYPPHYPGPTQHMTHSPSPPAQYPAQHVVYNNRGDWRDHQGINYSESRHHDMQMMQSYGRSGGRY